MKISKKDWQNYIARLRKINEKAAEKVANFMETHDYSTPEGMKLLIDYANAVATKYGEGAAELSCQMYDAIADASGAFVPAAEPAATATYGEIAKTIYGTMASTKDPVAVGAAVGRSVKLASVDTLQQNALRDGAEWAWIPSGDTCPYCIMLASRGWKKASKKAIKNGHADHIHNNCDCTYCVRFDHETTVEGYGDGEEYLDIYEKQKGIDQSIIDKMKKQGYDLNTPKGRMAAMRRQHYANNRDYINAQQRAAYAKHRDTLHPEDTRSIMNIDTGGERNEKPLTPEQIEECFAYAESLGMPRDRIAYSEIYYTSYDPVFDILLIGTDAYPGEKATSYNGRLNYRCAIAHELVGHREAGLRGKTHFSAKDLRDEAQASIRAARFTPGLESTERMLLLRDAVERCRKRGVNIQDIKDILDISER